MEEKSTSNTSTGTTTTKLTLRSKYLPTWSWASCRAYLNICAVENHAKISTHDEAVIPRTKIDIMRLGHIDVAGISRPSVLVRRPVVDVELHANKWISSIKYQRNGRDSVKKAMHEITRPS